MKIIKIEYEIKMVTLNHVNFFKSPFTKLQSPYMKSNKPLRSNNVNPKAATFIFCNNLNKELPSLYDTSPTSLLPFYTIFHLSILDYFLLIASVL